MADDCQACVRPLELRRIVKSGLPRAGSGWLARHNARVWKNWCAGKRWHQFCKLLYEKLYCFLIDGIFRTGSTSPGTLWETVKAVQVDTSGLGIPDALHMRFSISHALVPWVKASLFLKTAVLHHFSSCRFRYACHPQTPMSMHQETKDLRENKMKAELIK